MGKLWRGRCSGALVAWLALVGATLVLGWSQTCPERLWPESAFAGGETTLGMTGRLTLDCPKSFGRARTAGLLDRTAF